MIGSGILHSRRAAPFAVAAVIALAVALSSGPPAAGGARAPDGAYRGEVTTGGAQAKVRLRIAENGRKLKAFKLDPGLIVICGGAPFRLELHPVVAPAVRIKRNGRFKRTFDKVKGAEIKLEGRLLRRKGKIRDGSLTYQVGGCASKTVDWEAKRK